MTRMSAQARVRLNISIPEALYQQLSEVAERERRSKNGQVEVALREWLAQHEGARLVRSRPRQLPPMVQSANGASGDSGD
jgi:hypothetical protein